MRPQTTDPTSGTPASGVADGELTVDELAARTGLTVRTVRFYATEGLLPPPERRGRVAYYDARHRLRLDLIKTLQEHGYTLAAIDRVLQRVPHDAAPTEYAVQAAVLAPWLPEQTEIIDRAGLERRVGRRITDEQLEFLTSVGAVEPQEAGCYRVASRALGHAVEVLSLPVPRAVLDESSALIEEHATAVAEGLTELFARTIWGPYQRGEIADEQLVEILERMRPLAVQGMIGAFTRAADNAARRRVES